jgi:hypothetical protein
MLRAALVVNDIKKPLPGVWRREQESSAVPFGAAVLANSIAIVHCASTLEPPPAWVNPCGCAVENELGFCTEKPAAVREQAFFVLPAQPAIYHPL